jgi:ureidoacrylate peracid hydrolase
MNVCSVPAQPDQTAVLVIDMQRAFTASPLHPPLAGVLANLRGFLNEARTHGVPVVMVRIIIPAENYPDSWLRQYPEVGDDWLAEDAWTAAYEPGFEPRDGDHVLTKSRYSAFHQTDLESILHALDVRTVLVAGLTTDVCVGSTVRDAFQREFHTITLSDCCAEMTQAQHDAALQTLAHNFGAVCSSTDLVAVWRTARSRGLAADATTWT